jgi:hypothetical protein
MKNKAILVTLLTLVALVFALNIVSTVFATTTTDFVTINEVKVNGIDVTGSTAAGDVSDTVPVEVYFTANKDVSDVKVRVYIEGFKDDIYETTDRFHVIDGTSYVKRFTLKLPSTMDLNDLNEKISLYVKISALDEDPVEQDYGLEVQRFSYNLDILSADLPDKAVAGTTIPIDIVIRNDGHERLDNAYVLASIPELGVQKKVYLGDLGQNEETDSNFYVDISDSVNKKIYLDIPRTTVPGTYTVKIEAYNYDTSTSVSKKIVVSTVESGVIPTSNAKTIAVGEQTTFNLVLVNPSDRMVVYSLTPQATEGLTIDVEQPVLTVAAQSSANVKVNVKATNSATEGTHVVTVNVNSEAGLVKQVPFTVNVEKTNSVIGSTATGSTSGNVVLILTVVLVIIFVVLLIVLIVLLTKRPTQTEEFGETSYY